MFHSHSSSNQLELADSATNYLLTNQLNQLILHILEEKADPSIFASAYSCTVKRIETLLFKALPSEDFTPVVT